MSKKRRRITLSTWHCKACDVQGRSPESSPLCWWCEGDVIVVARPTIEVDEDESDVVT